MRRTGDLYVGVEGHVAVGQAGVPSSLREGPGRGCLQTLSQLRGDGLCVNLCV